MGSRMEDIGGIAHTLGSWKAPNIMNVGAVEEKFVKQGGEDNCNYRVARKH